jgi:hypothetical protein
MIADIGLNNLLHAGKRVCLGLFLRPTGSGKNKQESDAATHSVSPWVGVDGPEYYTLAGAMPRPESL